VAAFDVLRTVAAAAVVAIHVLGPYRARLGEMPDVEWASAIAVNGALRWCVPVFILITGALLLADTRPFDVRYFLRRRFAKVLVPFLAWSLLYAVVAGVSPAGFAPAVVAATVRAMPAHETYYHLGFFYYFIPLYVLVPPLLFFVRRAPRAAVLAVTLGWLVLTGLYLAGASGLWSSDFVLYGGYLLLGYVLWRERGVPIGPLVIPAAVALVAGQVAVIQASLASGDYEIGRYFSYKTLNTALIAAAVFALALRGSVSLGARARAASAFVGRHSLGIYLVHPLFLWPVRAFDLYAGHPLLVIPAWTAVAFGLALATSVALSRWRGTAWLVP
jgi:surface polysaccharide O-acyltransferase-like enzyme